MRALIIILGCALLCGCESQPVTQQDKAATAAAMGMMLMAGAARDNTAVSALWEVRIPPPALEVLGSIQAYRRTSGNWPKSEDIARPDGVSELLLNGTEEDLTIVMKKEQAIVMQCKILKDGTVVASPTFESFLAALQSHQSSRAPGFPVVIPPKK